LKNIDFKGKDKWLMEHIVIKLLRTKGI